MNSHSLSDAQSQKKKRPTEPLAKFSVEAINLDQFSEKKKQVPEQLEVNGVGSQ